MHVHELFNLKGKKALVTGGGRGLGEQIAHALAEAGADVIVCSRKVENCEEVAREIREATGQEAHALALDVTNPESVKEATAQALELFGQIDILVNNAGVSWGAKFFDMPLDKWNQVMNVNATGAFLMTQALAQGMIARKSGRIVNVASIAGLLGTDPTVMHAVGYHASKGALIAMTRDLAVKFARSGVTVNAIAPGFFPSKMTEALLSFGGKKILEGVPMKRFGNDHDLKGLAVYLASDASAYMTGQVLVLDGGSSAM
ncbi:SDR family oxidoreductase [Tumebacillus sp. ITR2]|uniref:SDR family oxidoreductase n=1 Tax=Tumebacillus amylolyticus TaxID=2801339 RepID=A0ABS1JEL1_9BACL|nr:SDR family oxidoreductase [Tumebacillus amylolyticus]MBL0388733.1 SDR family oxidoreductase [Tumebacillus amylolyticus]